MLRNASTARGSKCFAACSLMYSRALSFDHARRHAVHKSVHDGAASRAVSGEPAGGRARPSPYPPVRPKWVDVWTAPALNVLDEYGEG